MFGSEARAGWNHGYSAQHVAGADLLMEHHLVAGLGSVSCLGLLGWSFHPWAAQFRAVWQHMPGSFSERLDT